MFFDYFSFSRIQSFFIVLYLNWILTLLSKVQKFKHYSYNLLNISILYAFWILSIRNVVVPLMIDKDYGIVYNLKIYILLCVSWYLVYIIFKLVHGVRNKIYTSRVIIEFQWHNSNFFILVNSVLMQKNILFI